MKETSGARRVTSASLMGVLVAACAIALGATAWNARVAASAAPQEAGDNGIAPEGRAQIEALLREKETRSPAERKIDSQLLYAWRMRQGLPVAPGVQTLEVDIPYAADGHAVVEIKGRLTSSLLIQLNGVGTDIEKTGDTDLRMHVDLDRIHEIAAQPDTAYADPWTGAVYHFFAVSLAAKPMGMTGEVSLTWEGTPRSSRNAALPEKLVTTPSPTVRIGGETPSVGNGAFNGLLDELAAFSRVLSPAEVESIRSDGLACP